MKYSDKLGYVCNNCFCGLGNRLMILVGDMRVSVDHYNKDFYLYWKKLKYNFDELFDTNIAIFEDKPNDDYIFFDLDENEIRGKVASFPILEIDKKFINIENDHIGLSYDKIPQYFIDIYLPYFEILKPTKKINQIVNEYSKNFDDNTISIHVRRGDFLNYEKRSKNTDDKYFNEIENKLKKNSKTTFFISSDDPKTEQIFKEKYGNKIFLYPHTYDESQEDEKTALICILLLSKNKKMILSKYSTFSFLAWWFGGCKASVKII